MLILCLKLNNDDKFSSKIPSYVISGLFRPIIPRVYFLSSYMETKITVDNQSFLGALNYSSGWGRLGFVIMVVESC